MGRKILVTSTELMMLQFLVPHVNNLLSDGNDVDIACSEVGGRFHELKGKFEKPIKQYRIELYRSPFKVSNLKGLSQLKKIIASNSYDMIWTNEPVMGVMTRLAAHTSRKRGCRIVYMAHGFHFFKGAPLINWLVYYPVEKWLSRYTDVLITINKEDYALAKKKMRAGKVEYVPGVGVDLEKFGGRQVDVSGKRKELGIPDGMVWILAVGELSKRKNHRHLISAVAELEDVFLTIAGQGDLQDKLEKQIRDSGVGGRVKLIGFRTDISELCEAADVFAFPSYQEGLPVALMEAMASGKPVVCSRIRGNTDLIDEGKGGYYFEPDKPDEIAAAIRRIKDSDMAKMGFYNKEKMKHYDLSDVMEQSREIYESAAGGYSTSRRW